MDYGYLNARIRGMKSRLLDRKALENLIFRPDIESLIAELEKTPYRDEILAAKLQYTGIACIEHALRSNLAATYRKIAGFVTGTDGERFIAVLLERWDVQNIKTILRGKAVHITPEEIRDCLVPAGGLDEAALTEMIRQPDIRAVIDLLATWGVGSARPLTEAYPAYAENEDLVVLECALDRYYYAGAVARAAGGGMDGMLIRDLIRSEIDTVNIKTVLRMVRDRIEPSEAGRFFLEGGREFDPDRLAGLMNQGSVEGVIGELNQTPFRFLSAVADTPGGAGTISAFEKELDRYLVRQGVRSFFAYPLSIASAVGYFWAKFNEVINIRIISRCKTADISEAELAEELFYV